MKTDKLATFLRAGLCVAFLRMIVLAVVLTPTMARAAAPEARMVGPGAVALVAISPKAVLASPEFELFPREVLAEWLNQQYGIEPTEIELMTAAFAVPTPAEPPLHLITLRFGAPYNPATVFATQRKNLPSQKIQGRAVWGTRDSRVQCVCFADDRHVMVGSYAMIEAALSEPAGGTGFETWLPALDPGSGLKAVILVDQLRPILGPILAQAPLPPPIADLRRVPSDVSTLLVAIQVNGQGTRLALDIVCNESTQADQTAKTLSQTIAFSREVALQSIQRNFSASPGMGPGADRYAERLLDYLFRRIVITVDKTKVRVRAEVPASVAIAGPAVAMVLPAMNSAREKARLAMVKVNFRQLVVAYMVLADKNGRYVEPASRSNDGKPLLSWRVHLLPYLGQEALYNEFKLDEPWDSDHNRKLISRIPDLYVNPSGPVDERTKGLTHMQAVVGPGTLWNDAKSLKLDAQRDASSDTILFLEADQAVEWTRPEDLSLDPSNPFRGLGRLRNGRVLIGFADGSIRELVLKSIAPEVLSGAFTHSGGEQIAFPSRQ